MQATSPAEIFARLKELVIPYSKEMEVIMDTAGHYELRIPKEFTLGNAHHQGCYFCSLLTTTHYVSFNLVTHRLFPESFSVPPSLRKYLRPGGHFNFKKLTSVEEAAVAQLLQDSFALYKSRLSQP